jgi:predicted nucleic acid-binding protein
MRVYLDACGLSRLTDDQSQARIREEAEAIERVLVGVRRGTVHLISSEALEDEGRRNLSVARRMEVETCLSLASVTVKIDAAVAQRAQALKSAGYGPFDALHITAAESANADMMLSTDDHLIKRAGRGPSKPRIEVRNPVSWITEQGL